MRFKEVVVVTYIDMLFDSIFVEGVLQNFVVFNELIVELGIPLNL